MLAGAVRDAGAEVIAVVTADDVAQFSSLLDRYAREADLIITSGGVSAGAYEVVKDAFGRDGKGVEFVKVAMQPGMPQGIGRVAGATIVTLPGNPVSALVSSRSSSVPRCAGPWACPIPSGRTGPRSSPIADVAARQTSVPARDTRSRNQQRHQFRPPASHHLRWSRRRRAVGHPRRRRRGVRRNPAAGLGPELAPGSVRWPRGKTPPHRGPHRRDPALSPPHAYELVRSAVPPIHPARRPFVAAGLAMALVGRN